jgi:hypothetical protein
LNGTFIAFEESWGDVARTFANLGLDYKIEFLGAGNAVEAIKARMDGGIGAFFYLWTPHPLNAEYGLNRIQLPTYSVEGYKLGLTDYPVDVLEKVGSKRLADLAPEVAIVYSRFYIDNSDQEAMLMPLDAFGQSLAEAVCGWVHKEGAAAIWQAWLPTENLMCAVGQIANGSACEVCPAGAHSLGGTQTRCEQCAPGTLYPRPTLVDALPHREIVLVHRCVADRIRQNRFLSAACGAAELHELR